MKVATLKKECDYFEIDYSTFRDADTFRKALTPYYVRGDCFNPYKESKDQGSYVKTRTKSRRLSDSSDEAPPAYTEVALTPPVTV